MTHGKEINLADQWVRVRIALSLLATFVSESGYKKNKNKYNESPLVETLKGFADCPRPPDLHELFGMLSRSFDGVIPTLSRPRPCPPLKGAFVKQLFEIESNNAVPCVS